jgi:anti-sigma factor RsiW
VTCEELTEFLSRYVDGELPEAQRRVFEEHLGVCPPCEVYLESFREAIRLGREVSCPQEAEAMPERVVEAILAARKASRSGGS